MAYTVCAALLAPVCLAFHQPLAGYSTRTWVELAVLTVAAQLLGHTAFNLALPAVGSTPLSLAILLEVPGAALVAWVWLGQQPPLAVLPGAVLLLGGLVLVLRADSPTAPVDGVVDGPDGLPVAHLTSAPGDVVPGAG